MEASQEILPPTASMKSSTLTEPKVPLDQQSLQSPKAPPTRKRSMVPMSKAEYDKQQATVRHVFDEASGRMRLIRGSGEVVEQLVSRAQHDAINKNATRGDGAFFSSSVFQAANRKR